MSDDLERAISETAYGRRTFLRRLVMGSAFAVPVVSSFSMAGINAVSAHAAPLGNPNSTLGNCNSMLTTTNSDDPTIYTPNSTGEGGLLGRLEEIFELFTHQFGHK